MLNTCGLSEPKSLWMKFKESLCEDYYINARNIDADAIYTKDNNYGILSPNRELHTPLKNIF